MIFYKNPMFLLQNQNVSFIIHGEENGCFLLGTTTHVRRVSDDIKHPLQWLGACEYIE